MNLTRVLDSSLIRKPLFAMIVLEAVVVIGLAAAAWHVWQGRQAPPGASTGPLPALEPPSRALDPTRLPGASALPSPRPSQPPPPATPGFRVDAEFLSRQLGEINRDQSSLQKVEWRLVEAAIQGMKGYLERVVLPRVEQAEGRSR